LRSGLVQLLLGMQVIELKRLLGLLAYGHNRLLVLLQLLRL
jgi:hypothetical protein